MRLQGSGGRIVRGAFRRVRRLPYLRRPFHQRDVARAERDRALARVVELETMLRPAVLDDVPGPELRTGLGSLRDWRAFVAGHPQVFDSPLADSIAARALASGVRSDFLGAVPASRIVLRAGLPAYREHLLVDGLNSRQRALLDLTAEIFADWDPAQARIYAHEAVTPMALALRGRYPLFLGSEYAASEADAARLFPVPCLDAADTRLPSGCFDAVLSADVLEHVPDLAGTLRETARILKPGGRFFATMPFDHAAARTDIRARLVDGAVEHLAVPEYHVNPADEAGESLVFQIPGWDLLETCGAQGFSQARMVFWASSRNGIAGDRGLAGVFVLAAIR